MILLLILLQISASNDVLELRKFLGADFAGALKLLAPHNEFLLRNVRPTAPAQAAEMQAQMARPASLGEKENVVPLTISNAGRGLVTVLFRDDFITEQVNLVFCPTSTRRIIGLQVLFGDRRAIGDTVSLFQKVYKLPQPSKFEGHKPAISYSLFGVSYDKDGGWIRGPSAPPVTVWSLDDSVEAVYQPVVGQQLITGQFWLGDKTAAKTCSAPATTPR